MAEIGHAAEHEHPQPLTYIKIAVVLTVITALEVALYYLPTPRGLLPILLIALSTGKFALVVMFYMHLKFDNRIFSAMFLFGLSAAGFTIIAFLALFGFVHLG
jgi:caa(3)-type oxidase subunit IV